MKRNWDIDGFLAYGRHAIYVDQFHMMKRLRRYRFTLAHQLSHLLLHEDIYEGANIESLEDYVRFQNDLDPDLRAAYEFQAMNLAGRVLLPEVSFFGLCEKTLSSVRHRLPADVDRALLGELIAAKVAAVFEVSEEVAVRRLFKDRLWEKGGW